MVYTWYMPGINRISEYTWYIHVYTYYLPRRGSRWHPPIHRMYWKLARCIEVYWRMYPMYYFHGRMYSMMYWCVLNYARMYQVMYWDMYWRCNKGCIGCIEIWQDVLWNVLDVLNWARMYWITPGCIRWCTGICIGYVTKDVFDVLRFCRMYCEMY